MQLDRLVVVVAFAAVVAVSLSGSRGASAQERDPGDGDVSSKLSVYSDDDQTTVVTGAVDAQVVAPYDIAVGAYALIDAVSTASVDVVSSATGRWTEERVELGGSAGIDLSETAGLTLSVANSRENDWQSHTASLSVRKEVAGRNAELSGAYALVLNQVGRAGDPAFERSLNVHSIQLGASQLWSTRTLFALTYNLQVAGGYQASPYRFADVGGTQMPEAHPETRIRHAVTARHLRAMGDSMALESTYRFYIDDWGIASHTLSTGLTFEATRWLDLRARARGYQQTGAAFYSDGYNQPRMFVTSDRELSPFWNVGGGLKAAVYVGRFVFDLKLDAIHYRFSDVERLPERTALVSGAGAKLTW